MEEQLLLAGDLSRSIFMPWVDSSSGQPTTATCSLANAKLCASVRRLNAFAHFVIGWPWNDATQADPAN